VTLPWQVLDWSPRPPKGGGATAREGPGEDRRCRHHRPALRFRKNDVTRLYQALVDGRVIGELAYRTWCE
jgi:hypothetical protein